MADPAFIQHIEEVHCDGGKTVYRRGQPIIEGGPPVKHVGEHRPSGPGDCWVYEIGLEDQSSIMVFNMTKVIFGKPKKNKALIVPGGGLITP